MRAWNLGNTTVRSPFRLRDGLRVLVNSDLHGNLIGKSRQQEFARLLAENAVVAALRLKEDGNLDASDLGRKWHGALVKMGFITPKLSNTVNEQGVDPRLRDLVSDIPSLTGRPFEITPHGQRLLDADSLAAQQELFLRSLVALQMPSPVEKLFHGKTAFSPLRIVLEILDGLERQGLEASLSFEEIRYIVQFVMAMTEIPACVEDVARFRRNRAKAASKPRFDQEYEKTIEPSLENQSLETTADYADSNLRYLKATGLFLAKGRGITIAPPRYPLIRQLLAAPFTAMDGPVFLRTLWVGTPLPTDEPDQAREAITTIADALRASGETVELPFLPALGAQELQQELLILNERYELALERAYASRQEMEWRDIVGYLVKLRALRKREGPYIPREMAPVYFEWAVWRAFLAIDSLINQPWEARKFKFSSVEEAPISGAPSGAPDMLFEFERYVLVVEVTLTQGSRQEAAEGEPVRRHVANVVEAFADTGKPVLGLFIAHEIDTNTAHTFQQRIWYGQNDRAIRVDIVPLTLAQFTTLFEFAFNANGVLLPDVILNLCLSCLENAGATPAEWKQKISARVESLISDLAQAQQG